MRADSFVPLPVSLSVADINLRDPLTVDDVVAPWVWPVCDDAGRAAVSVDLWDVVCGGVR